MSGIQVLENIWLDDNTFIVDGKTMNKEALNALDYTPKKVSVSPNNKKLLDAIKKTREENPTYTQILEKITKLTQHKK